MGEHKDETELLDLLRVCPRNGSCWRHYRGTLYRVVGCAIDEATLVPRVHYQRADAAYRVVWSRPLSEWLETITVDGRTVQRYVELYDG